ncbi:MAG: outer membrane beta-barrel protein [Methylophilus sp.]|nr:outer membrane beta-barrel protein [Methylophilus sp.]
MLDLKPYVYTNVTYDDNLFRYASEAEAKANGITNRSDVQKTLGAGLSANLRLSRQLLSASVNLSENKFDRYSSLDNTGKSMSLAWNWRVGSDLYGVISASESESISSFSDTKDTARNLKKYTKERASINWSFMPSWTVYGTADLSDLENERVSQKSLDREDEAYEVGVNYNNPLGTQAGLFFRVADSQYPNRANTDVEVNLGSGIFGTVFGTYPLSEVYGSKAKNKQYGVNLAWLPTHKVRLSSRISFVDFETNVQTKAIASGLPLPYIQSFTIKSRDFTGVNQRWDLAYTLSSKTNVGLTAYDEISQVDSLQTLSVKNRGIGASLNWSITSKVGFKSGFTFDKRDYQGDAGIDNNDKSIGLNLGLTYLPTNKSMIQLEYQGGKRDANISTNDYQFNSINFLAQYNF